MNKSSSSHSAEDYGCSIVGVIITLIVIGVLLIIPAILGGGVIFLGIPDSSLVDFDPGFLAMLPYMLLSMPLLIILIFVVYFYSRRTDREM
ncbi:MAG: hypothetical protein ACFFE6_08320 [Candidatus Thorarchaeota archaeon]